MSSRYEEYDDTDDFERHLVFVIMPFTDELDDAYQAIKAECATLGLVTKRVDENVGSGLVINEITSLIIKAEFIICDLTKERPNVYYDLGFAHGVGNESLDVFLIAQHDTKLHFDVGAFRVRYYRSVEHLRTILRDNFAAMVKVRREALS